MSDELLVVRAQLGNRSALEGLVARWQRPVWLYVRRMLDAERADDVTQEAWIAVVRALPRLREPDRFTPWLFTIVRRAALNRLRDQYADRRDLVGDLEQTEADRSVPSTRDPVDGLVDRAEMVARLAGLPLPEREVLVLTWLLRSRVPLFATDRLVAAWIGLAASVLTSALLVGLAVQRGSGAWGVIVVAAVLVAIAILLVVRAHAQRAALLRRERTLTDDDPPPPASR